MSQTALPRVTATRYVAPLREGGSLPGLVEADDLGTYVCKFRGAGQGVGVLVAEVIVGELARSLGIRTPDLVAVELEDAIARYEADEEVQDLLRASLGLNLGVDFLPGSFGFDPSVPVDRETAGRILWLDAFVANVDRSWRNPNLLVWHGDVWLIDHGASLYFHHAWASADKLIARPYDASDHVLATFVDDAGLAAAGRDLGPKVTEDLLREVVALVPEEWLADEPGFDSPAEVAAAYVTHLRTRAATPDKWLPEVGEARPAAPRTEHRPSARPKWLE